MATYVNNLRLKEIATGDESGTWGASTNTNLELIAEAFGFGTEAITTNADTHTTTISDGTSDPGRSIFLKYTGTLDSACTITIGPNDIKKLWFIENATTGSQNIIIKQGSGATVTIANGQTKAIYSDGAGSGGAMVDAFTDLSVPSLFLPDNGKANFGADSDLQIFHDGSHSRLVDSGTGNFIIQAGEFRVNTSDDSEAMIKGNENGDVELYFNGAEKLATTSTGIDVTGSVTADGLDVEIADNAASPVTMQQGGNSYFKIVTTNSSESVQLGNSTTNPNILLGGGKLLHGTTSVPTGVLLGNQLVSSSATGAEIIAFRADTSVAVNDLTGAFLLGNSDTDGTEDHFVGMYGKVSSTNGSQNVHFVAGRSGYEGDSPDLTLFSGGDLSLGTTSPAAEAKLHVEVATSNPNSGSPTDSSAVMINGGTTTEGSGPVLALRNISGSKETIVRLCAETASGNNGDLTISTYGGGATIDEVVRFTGGGNVGIGTASPSQKLHVVGKIKSTDDLIIGGTSPRIDYDGGSSGALRFFSVSANTERMRIDSSGNVGIGRTDPNAPLDIMGSAAGQLSLLRIRNSNIDVAAEAKMILSLNRTGSDIDFECAGIVAGKEQTWTGTSSTVDGFLSFRTIQNETTAEKMRITSGGQLLIGHTSAVATHAEKLGIDCDQASGFGIFVSGDASTGGSTNVTAMRFYDSGSSAGVVGSIVFNTSSTAFNTSSDYRLKENVTDLTNATARLKQLEPKRFNFKGNADKTVDGFLAHEVSSIVPEAITGEKDAVDDEGEPVYQGIDQSKLVPLLVATIKELEARIAALESQ